MADAPFFAGASPAAPWNAYDERRRRVLLLSLFLVSTSSYADRSLMGVLLEPIKAEFGVSDTALGLLTGAAFVVFYATLGVPLASLADRGDRKRIILVSLAVWSAMTAFCGLAATFWLLALARIGVGAGEAGVTPASQSLIADYFAPQARGRALGVFMMSSVSGAILGLGVGGTVATAMGWRAAFVACGLVGVPLLFLGQWVLREPRRESGVVNWGVARESPLAATNALLRSRTYSKLLVGFILLFMANQGALSFTVSLLVRLHGYTVKDAGIAVAALSASSAVLGNPAGGALADRLSVRDTRWLCWLPGGSLVLATPCILLGLAAQSPAGMLAGLFLGNALLCIMTPPLFAALHLVCGAQRRAMAVAVVFLLGNLIGSGLGPVVTGALSDLLGQAYGSGEGLRHAMMAVLLLLPVSGSYILSAARDVRDDAPP